MLHCKGGQSAPIAALYEYISPGVALALIFLAIHQFSFLRNLTLSQPTYSDFVHIMQFLALILSLGFVASAFAQSVVIGSPSDGSTVTAGQSITVDVLKPVRANPLPHFLKLQ